MHRDVGISYRSLAAHVLAARDDIAATGIRPGQILGVEAGDRYLHLLVVLAAEAMGVTTMTLIAAELEPPDRMDQLCDRIIMSRPPPGMPLAKLLTMPTDWLARILARPPRDDRLDELEGQPESQAVVRLIKSSGTTGAAKVMGMTQRVQQRVIQKLLLHAPVWVKAHPDYLCLYNFGVRASHARALMTLQLGGTIHLTGIDVLWDLITAGIGNFAMFVAGDFDRFVRAAPHGRGPFALYLEVVGAAVPPRLRQEARSKLTQHIVVTYSSNETNRVSLVDEDNVGTLFPGVSIRIVDPGGRPEPNGRPGVIWVKTDTMTDGYINAPKLSRTAFVDGWFRTSDVGFQPSDDTLVVLGRDDEMLNIGGLKVAPGPIEQRLKAINGISDALVTSIDDYLETRIMLVAIETEPGVRPADLSRLVMPIIQSRIAHFQLLMLPLFPRTDTGKIRRQAVQELFRRHART